MTTKVSHNFFKKHLVSEKSYYFVKDHPKREFSTFLRFFIFYLCVKNWLFHVWYILKIKISIKLQSCRVAFQIYWDFISASVFFCKFSAYFQNTCSYGHLWRAPSGKFKLRASYKRCSYLTYKVMRFRTL